MVIGYAFVDAADGHLKVKKADNVIVEYTNTLSDIQILDLTDYTAFEVYAHDTRINAGALSGQTHINYIGNQNDIITFAVAPSMTETFILRSEQPQSEQDVIVDWGDGNFEKVIDITPTESSGEYRFTLTHTYSTTGTYIVKIFGKTYFSFSSSGSVNTSLISRIFDHDLPIASHIWNLSSAFQHSNRLLHVNMWSHPASYQIIHWSAAFTSARNLIDCVGFSKYAHRESNYNMFQNCIGLVSTDLRIADNPADLATGNAYTFTNCPKLAMNIGSLLPVQGFKSGSTINIARLFKGCALLYGTVPADKLWNNQNITWTNTSEAFTGCSEALSGQVPVSWGGSASDDIIKPKLTVMEDVVVSGGLSNTIDIVEGGKRYLVKVNSNGVVENSGGAGTLILTAVENSPLESEIWVYFEPGEEITVDTPNSLGWFKTPGFSDGKYYIINIRNNVAVSHEYTPGV